MRTDPPLALRRVPVLLALALLSACSSSSGGSPVTVQASGGVPLVSPTALASPSTGSSTSPSTSPSTSVAAPTSGTSAAGAPAASSAPAAAPRATTAPGQASPSKATAAGDYTYDRSGTVTLGDPGTPQDASGTSTLTVSAVKGDAQRFSTESESTGSTVEDLLVRDRGTYLTSLTISSPAFTKEFRPSPAAVLVPDPARVGDRWSASGTSTDGKTRVSSASSVSRTQTLTIGGRSVPCVVVLNHLELRGDIDYTTDVTTWWAPSLRLPVKDHTVGKGSYNGFPFSTDITSVLRSVEPS